MKEYIIVLNYNTGSVHIHHIYIDDSIQEEDKITKFGYKLDECEWMITKELNLTITEDY